MLRLAFDFIITWRETRTRPNAYSVRSPLATLPETSVKKKRKKLHPIHNYKKNAPPKGRALSNIK